MESPADRTRGPWLRHLSAWRGASRQGGARRRRALPAKVHGAQYRALPEREALRPREGGKARERAPGEAEERPDGELRGQRRGAAARAARASEADLRQAGG